MWVWFVRVVVRALAKRLVQWGASLGENNGVRALVKTLVFLCELGVSGLLFLHGEGFAFIAGDGTHRNGGGIFGEFCATRVHG